MLSADAPDPRAGRRAELLGELSAEELEALPGAVFPKRSPAVARFLWSACDLTYLATTHAVPLGVPDRGQRAAAVVPTRGTAFRDRRNRGADGWKNASARNFAAFVFNRYDDKETYLGRQNRSLGPADVPTCAFIVALITIPIIVIAGFLTFAAANDGANNTFCFGFGDTALTVFRGGEASLGTELSCPELAVAPVEIAGPRPGVWNCTCDGDAQRAIAAAAAGAGEAPLAARPCADADDGEACLSGRSCTITVVCSSGRTSCSATGPAREVCVLRDTYDVSAPTIQRAGEDPRVRRAAVAGRAAAEAWRPAAEAPCCRRDDGTLSADPCEIYRTGCSGAGGFFGLILTTAVTVGAAALGICVASIVAREIAWAVAYPRILAAREAAADRRIELEDARARDRGDM